MDHNFPNEPATDIGSKINPFANITGALVFSGECMLELVNKSYDHLGKSFAGDLFNSSVYLKRAFPTINIEFMSCVGQDCLSSELVSRVEAEHIGTQFLTRTSNHHLGAYMVVTDDHGERSFIYWRSESAARRMLSALSSEQSSSLINCGVFFFSGISLAILLDEERLLFWELLTLMKQAGVTIVFDPNYRPQLWQTTDIAKAQIEKAFQLADVLLPGLDDFDKLYGVNNIQECIALCQRYPAKEIIMKQGEKSVYIVTPQSIDMISIVPNENVVDTTSAGDAFNGVYLGARVSGHSAKAAVLAASAAASKVIETPGAIMPKPLFDKFWQAYTFAEPTL